MKYLSILPIVLFGILFISHSVAEDVSKNQKYCDIHIDTHEYELAISECMPLAQLGNPEYQFKLGAAYIELDKYSNGEKWLSLATKNGENGACHFLALKYLVEKKNSEKGLHWLKICINEGNVLSLYTLANIYLYGGMGSVFPNITEKNEEKGLELLNLAISVGYAETIKYFIAYYESTGNEEKLEYWTKKYEN